MDLCCEVPFRRRRLRGYLRVPPGIEPAPVVVLFNGTNSVKEELHWWSESLLSRGIATLVFDGPGLGETFHRMSMVAEPRPVGHAIVNALQAHPELDPEAIAFFGQSLDTVKGWAKQGMPGKAPAYDLQAIVRWLRQKGPWRDRAPRQTPATDEEALLLGGHGDDMVPLARYTFAGGIPITQLVKPERLAQIIQRARDGGAEIVTRPSSPAAARASSRSRRTWRRGRWRTWWRRRARATSSARWSCSCCSSRSTGCSSSSRTRSR